MSCKTLELLFDKLRVSPEKINSPRRLSMTKFSGIADMILMTPSSVATAYLTSEALNNLMVVDKSTSVLFGTLAGGLLFSFLFDRGINLLSTAYAVRFMYSNDPHYFSQRSTNSKNP